MPAQQSASQHIPKRVRGVPEGITGMETPGESLVLREPTVKSGKSRLIDGERFIRPEE